MAKLVSAEKISLKKHPEIKEDHIQQFIFDNPSVLGLGDLEPVRREKVQPNGGRLDILLEDEDTRYEVEIMLGATDPSHIIRTIEYWDSERKRYPQFDHCAVIVAEEITGRFMNVISLFNGAIPLIALQMTATKHGNDINLSFVKVIDRIIPGTDDDSDFEQADRGYWEKKTNSLKIIDSIASAVKKIDSDYELKYKRSRITLNESMAFHNRILFYPKKNIVTFVIKTPEIPEISEQLEELKINWEYRNKNQSYRFKFRKESDYSDIKDIVNEILIAAINNEE